MSYAHLLIRIEHALKSLTSFTKLLFLFIPLLILLILFIFLKSSNNTNDITNINLIEQKIVTLKMKRNQKLYILQVIKDIESYADKSRVILHSIEQKNKELDIKFKVAMIDFLSFVEFCEWFHAFSMIEYLNIVQENNQIKGQMKLSFAQFYEKNRRYNYEKDKVIQNNEYVLNAIVGKYVIINNKILGLNDSIHDFVIKSIQKNRVFLHNKKEIKILEVYDHVE